MAGRWSTFKVDSYPHRFSNWIPINETEFVFFFLTHLNKKKEKKKEEQKPQNM